MTVLDNNPWERVFIFIIMAPFFEDTLRYNTSLQAESKTQKVPTSNIIFFIILIFVKLLIFLKSDKIEIVEMIFIYLIFCSFYLYPIFIQFWEKRVSFKGMIYFGKIDFKFVHLHELN